MIVKYAAVLAILAIMSTSLWQMYVATTTLQDMAYTMDRERRR